MGVTEENDGSMVETKCISEGFNNGCVSSFVIGGFREEDFRIHVVVSKGVTKDPHGSKRAWITTASTVGEDE